MKNVLQLSGGKDSLALFLVGIEKEYPIDEVVYFDVGEWEFQAVRNVVRAVEQICKQKGIKFTSLHPKESFDYLAWERTYRRRDGTIKKGYEWCGGLCRWGTTQKLQALDKHCIDNVQVVGIATDEQKRLTSVLSKKGTRAFWLNEWRMTESDCLEYCYAHGWHWKEYDPITKNEIDLYSILDRVSCYCCHNKNLKELKNIYLYLPTYWNRLKEMQIKTDRPFKQCGSIFKLEERFNNECMK